MTNKWTKKFIEEFKSLKQFDYIWLLLCTIGITLVSLSTNNSFLSIISSIMGVIYVILNGCRLSVAFLFGIVNTFLYGIVSYQNGLYGDFMLNVFYSCPCCIIGLIAWFKASEKKAQASISSFKLKEKIIFLSIIIIGIIAYGYILKLLNDTQPYLDATTTVISISAYICLILRKKEVWYLFNFSNILSIVMWGINYSYSNANLAILAMYVIYTANSILNTIRWEKANKPLLEVDILLYKGEPDLKWLRKLNKTRDDLIINVYLYGTQTITSDKSFNTHHIPKRITTYGSAYNYIISKVHSKYFILLDNTDCLDVTSFNKLISHQLLLKDYELIRTNYFLTVENNKSQKKYDDYTGTNKEIEEKIMNRKIFPYFFGNRIYKTSFIKKHNIRFNDTNMYNDVYPNILLARSLDMNKVLILDGLFYTRNRQDWHSFTYDKNDLKTMIESLIKIDVQKDQIFNRLVDSYNYSINERGGEKSYFISVVKDFFDIKDFNKAIKKRNKKSLYLNNK